MRPFVLAMILVSSLAAPRVAGADPFTVSASSGSLAASALFATAGSNLVITLTNTSLADVLVPADVLTALFFDLPGAGVLSSVSAVLNAGSSVVYDTDGQPAGGVVGGEWAYGSGLAGAPGGATRGISSAGFGLFGGSTFPGADLQFSRRLKRAQLWNSVGRRQRRDREYWRNRQRRNDQELGHFHIVRLAPGFDPSAAGAITNVRFQSASAE